MAKFDIGPDTTPLPSANAGRDVSPPRRRLTLRWRDDQGERLSTLIAGGPAVFGRQSTCDVTLRIEPTGREENKAATLQISSSHFLVHFEDGKAYLSDTSSNGTEIMTVRLEPNKPTPLAHDTVLDIAGVLQMLAHVIEEDDGVRFVRLRRRNNLPEVEYLLLCGAATVDGSERSLLPLPVTPSGRVRSVRALDIGPAAAPQAAAAVILPRHENQDGLFIRRTGREELRVNEHVLSENEIHPLPDSGTVTIGQTRFQIER